MMAEGGEGNEAGSAKQCHSLAFISRSASLTLPPGIELIYLLPGKGALLKAIIHASGECGVGTFGRIVSHVCRRDCPVKAASARSLSNVSTARAHPIVRKPRAQESILKV
jgi:hypothetical protein